MQCSNCGKDNAASSKFCQYCGTHLAASPAGSTQIDRALPPQSQPDIQPLTSSPADWGSIESTPYSHTLPSRPQTSVAPADWGTNQPAPYPAGKPAPTMSQMGTGGAAAVNIWGPFAGFGTRGHHFSWLLDDLSEKAEALHQTFGERFQRREVPRVAAGWRELIGKGLWVERRRYYLIRREITTVALYMGKFGQDLFISMVTYVKGPISNFRVVLVGLILLFQLFYIFGYMPMLASTASEVDILFGTGPSIGSMLFLLCIVGPMGIVNSIIVGLIFLYSIYKWLTERDFLAILRTPPNEFQIDDTVALEKSVEETVRQALDAVGIDPNLMPARPEQTYRRRLV